MSKHLYYRERALEDAMRSGIDYSLHGYHAPADYNARHGLRSVSHAYATVPTGAHTTPMPLRDYVHPRMENEFLAGDESRGPAMLALGLLAGFFLFLR